MGTTPYVGFGNDTLEKLPSLNAGDLIRCPTCNEQHAVTSGDDGSTLLLFYQCGGKAYVAAMAGKNVMGTPSDVHGEVDLLTTPDDTTPPTSAAISEEELQLWREADDCLSAHDAQRAIAEIAHLRALPRDTDYTALLARQTQEIAQLRQARDRWQSSAEYTGQEIVKARNEVATLRARLAEAVEERRVANADADSAANQHDGLVDRLAETEATSMARGELLREIICAWEGPVHAGVGLALIARARAALAPTQPARTAACSRCGGTGEIGDGHGSDPCPRCCTAPAPPPAAPLVYGRLARKISALVEDEPPAAQREGPIKLPVRIEREGTVERLIDGGGRHCFSFWLGNTQGNPSPLPQIAAALNAAPQPERDWGEVDWDHDTELLRREPHETLVGMLIAAAKSCRATRTALAEKTAEHELAYAAGIAAIRDRDSLRAEITRLQAELQESNRLSAHYSRQLSDELRKPAAATPEAGMGDMERLDWLEKSRQYLSYDDTDPDHAYPWNLSGRHTWHSTVRGAIDAAMNDVARKARSEGE